MECKVCGKKCEKEYCFHHKPRKPLPKMSSLFVKKLDKSSYKNLEMKEFFLSIWKERPHKSEISGEPLGNESLSIYFHHILPKKKYPELAYEPSNIILLSWEEHDNVELNPFKYEEVNKKREQLKIKFNIT